MYRRWILKPVMYVSAGYFTSKIFKLIGRFRNIFKDNYYNHQFLKERSIFNYEITGLYLGFFGSIILDRFNMIIDNTPKLIEQ